MFLNFARTVLMCTLSLGAAIAADRPTLRLEQTIPLAGVTGRFDHFAIDRKNQRLFVAALGNNSVEVIDVSSARRLQSIRNLRKPQGMAYLVDQNQIVVASGDDGTVKFFNGASYELEHSVAGLDDADNVRFDPRHRRLYVGYGDGALAEIDIATMKITADIKLAGHPESFQLEQQGSRIFVNVPEAKHVAVVDRTSHRVIATWPLTDEGSNFPMALDEANRRLLIGCRTPSRLVVLDTETGRRVAAVAISGDTDDLFYDEAHQRIYLSCGAGSVDVIEQTTADQYKVGRKIPTSSGARTSFFVPDLARLFVAVPQTGNQSAEIRGFQIE